MNKQYIMIYTDQLYPRLKVSSMTGEMSLAAVKILCSASYLVGRVITVRVAAS